MARAYRRLERPMWLAPPSIGNFIFYQREMALLAIGSPGLSMYSFSLWQVGLGRAMGPAVRDAEIAARSIDLILLPFKGRGVS